MNGYHQNLYNCRLIYILVASFTSLGFVLFLPIVALLFFMFGQKIRIIFLLLASYYFYMSWRPEYAILILLSTVVDYFAGILISKNKSLLQRRLFLAISLTVNLGLLFFFKYFNFLSDSLRHILSLVSVQMDPIFQTFILPVGISFYTFQTIGYTVDVYNKKIEPQKNFLKFALYVSFFPQLVAGPIERAKNLFPQFDMTHKFEINRATDGLKLMLWGFFKKLVIADNAAIVVDTIYADPAHFGGVYLWIATILFSIQIYCDFSGYSDIAIGCAKILGFKLMDNFNRPYFSKSIAEFWRRWHISLSTWFKDYIYIPLGGSRVGKIRWSLNIMLVFLISGIWHGANWTFIVWGILHGFFIVVSPFTKKVSIFARKMVLMKENGLVSCLLQVVTTYLLVLLAWVFFRSPSITSAWDIIKRMLTPAVHEFGIQSIGLSTGSLIAVFVAIVFMELIHFCQEHSGMREMFDNKSALIRVSAYMFMIIFIVLFGAFGKGSFIYFQF